MNNRKYGDNENAPAAGSSGNGDNPYSQGSPRVDRTGSTATGYGLNGSYYTNPQTSGAGNPHSSGALDAADDASQYIADGLDNVYADRLAYYSGSEADAASQQQNLVDSGIDDQKIPPAQRR